MITCENTSGKIFMNNFISLSDNCLVRLVFSSPSIDTLTVLAPSSCLDRVITKLLGPSDVSIKYSTSLNIF